MSRSCLCSESWFSNPMWMNLVGSISKFVQLVLQVFTCWHRWQGRGNPIRAKCAGHLHDNLGMHHSGTLANSRSRELPPTLGKWSHSVLRLVYAKTSVSCVSERIYTGIYASYVTYEAYILLVRHTVCLTRRISPQLFISIYSIFLYFKHTEWRKRDQHIIEIHQIFTGRWCCVVVSRFRICRMRISFFEYKSFLHESIYPYYANFVIEIASGSFFSTSLEKFVLH